MSKCCHVYTILSVTSPLYIALNFSWPRFILPDEDGCLLNTSDCTLLQKMIRYRSEGPIQVKDQELRGNELAGIPLLLDGGSDPHSVISLSAAVSGTMTWDQGLPAVRKIQTMSALFFSRDACDQAGRDILAYAHYFPGILLRGRQEPRKPKGSEEAICSCSLKSVYNGVAFYADRESCRRHAQLIALPPGSPIRQDVAKGETARSLSFKQTRLPILLAR